MQRPPSEAVVLFMSAHAGRINPIVSNLTVDSPQSQISSMPWEMVEKRGDSEVAEALACQDREGAKESIRVIREIVPVLRKAHSQVDDQIKLDSTLYGALTMLKELGSRYRRPELVEQVTKGLESLLAGRQEHSVFAQMLGLPSLMNTVPVRRKHRRRGDRDAQALDVRPLVSPPLVPDFSNVLPPILSPSSSPVSISTIIHAVNQPVTPDSEDWLHFVQMLQSEDSQQRPGKKHRVSLFGEALSQDVSPESSLGAWPTGRVSPNISGTGGVSPNISGRLP